MDFFKEKSLEVEMLGLEQSIWVKQGKRGEACGAV